MSRTRLGFPILVASVLASACAPIATESPADMACAAAVPKALELLPSSVTVQVETIDAGRSGSAVSCKVSGPADSVMIDATASCAGTVEELQYCTTINQISMMDGTIIYPGEGSTPETGE